MALCSCEVKRCSICASNVLIFTDIILHIITSAFIVPGRTGPSSGGGNSDVDRRIGVVFLLELNPGNGCVYVRWSVAMGVFPSVERGIGAMGL